MTVKLDSLNSSISLNSVRQDSLASIDKEDEEVKWYHEHKLEFKDNMPLHTCYNKFMGRKKLFE